MSVVGFLGYFGIGTFPSKIFSFFRTVLGAYSLIIPTICLIFTIVCWRIFKKPKHMDIDKYEDEDLDNKKIEVIHSNRPSYSFSNYFSGQPLFLDRHTNNENKYKSLGTNYSTYFGQGERNIFLPARTVNLNGFRDYFRGSGSVSDNYSQAANDTIIRDNHKITRDSHTDIFPTQRVFPRQIVSKYYSTEEDDDSENQKADRTKTDNAIKFEKPTAKGWQLPGLDLLCLPDRTEQNQEEHHANLLEDVLSTFGITAKVVNISMGPVITRYELSPAPGTKISKIVSLADDIALALASRDIRIEAPIPGKAAVGIEIPRINPRTVFFREVIDTNIFRNSKAKLRVILGKDIANETVVSELEKMPHLLVAGATGSGKSIFINCLINSLLYTVTPDDLRFLMIDPKMVELSQYNGIPHLLSPVVTDPKKANKYLKHIVLEMENRYELFASNGVRDIDHYNKSTKGKSLPYIVVIIDELSDLMMVASNEIEESVCRLAQMARAAGIHLVIATQRPSVNVITGLIKANIPSRISFAVSSQIDSRTILDTGGAEKLLGKGDMLYSPIGLNKPLRVHGCFIDEQEVKNVIEHWKNQGVAAYTLSDDQIEEPKNAEKDDDDFDERFSDAGQLVISTGIASVSFLQRRLRVGYSRAARLMDMLEEAGVVGAYEGNKPRNILMSLESFNTNYGSEKRLSN